MRKNLMLKKVIAIVKLSFCISLFWPLPKDTIRFKVICVELYHCLCGILSLGLLVGLINSFRNHLDDPVIMVKSFVFVTPILQVIYNLVCCKINSYRLQLVANEMENFCQLMKPQEEIVVQQYIDKCCNFYGGSIIWYYLTTIIVIVGPVTLDQPFPTIAEYPFDMFSQPLRFIIYVLQSFVGLQITCTVCLNIYMALLLWHTSIKFELLSEELRTVTDIYGLMKWIRKHQKLLKFSEEVVALVRLFVLSSISVTTCGIIALSLVFFTEVPLSMKVQCVTVTFTGLSEVFMYTWPAEHLIHLSSNVGESVFDAEWYKMPAGLQKSMLMIILRAQKPIIISLPCIMPSLSLNYYTAYLSTIFSYFTTLRIFMQNDQDGE